MENGPFEDVFPIKNGDIPASYVSLPKGTRGRELQILSKIKNSWQKGEDLKFEIDKFWLNISDC